MRDEKQLSQNSSAVRVRRMRQRQRQGMAMSIWLPITREEIMALVHRGYLREEFIENRREVKAALRSLLRKIRALYYE